MTRLSMSERTRHTGRHIVLLRDGFGRSGAQTLRNTAGLRVEISADHEGSVRRHSIAGEGILFHRLGAALIHADPDQLAALQTGTGGELLVVEPERVVYAIQFAGDTA